ncbi:MAG: hypothetical protein CL816_06815 [Coxiellaceae bacterium]|nr:hypothetical protein [Coxiellaceae bacterium]
MLRKKILPITTISSLTGLLLSLSMSTAIADESTYQPGMILAQVQQAITGLSNGMNQLGEQIQQLSLAQQEADNSYRYQNDPQLGTISSNNSGSDMAHQTANNSANQLSNQSVLSELQPMSYAGIETSTSDGVAVTDTNQASAAKDTLSNINSAIQDNSWGITASDTLFANFNFSTNPIPNYEINGQEVDPVFQNQPTTLHDDYFNFANFFAPTSLNYNDSSDGLEAANHFVNFIVGDFEPMYNKIINLNDLNSAIASANTSDPTGATGANILRQLTTSKAFQQAQLTVRQATAQRSIATYTLNKIQAEREAILSKDDQPQLDSIAANMGVEVSKDNDGNYVYPSKAQIDNYQANHDLNSESWYQNLQTLSGPNIQRETLITMKQIQQSLVQQHQDNEIIQALLASSNIQASAANVLMLQTTKKQFSDWIKSVPEDLKNIKSPDDSGTGTSS